MHIKFGFIPVRPPFMLENAAFESIIGGYVTALEDMGGQRWSDDQMSDPAQLFFLVGTGGTEEIILNLHAQRQDIAPNEPVFVIAHPGNNSLPASLEVLARLQQEGMAGQIFYLKGPDDTAGLQKISRALHDLETIHTLQNARIGLVGPPSNWLVASMPNPDDIKNLWGPEVIPIDMQEITQAMQAIPDEALSPIRDPLTNAAAEVREPAPQALNDVTRVYVALKQLVEHYHLDAITVRCFDLVLEHQTTGCFALAQLTDEGIIAGCEGDLVSTVGMLWAYILLGEIPWMANPAQLDEAQNTMWLAHCTISLKMVQEYGLRSHFESNLGVGIQGTLPPGPVTLLRIGGKQMDQLWVAEGDLIQAGYAENLCRTQAEVKLHAGGHVGDLLRAPLGNHLVLIKGHHRDHLQDWWQMMISL